MNKGLLALLFLFLLILPSTGMKDTNALTTVANEQSDLSGVKVALFFASNTEISNACRRAMESMYEWMNASVDVITPDEIKDGALYNYDILGIPPGNLGEYNVKLGYDGIDAIRDYLRNGGSYIGISRGAHFACKVVNWVETNEYLLQIFNGTGQGPMFGQLGQAMQSININNDCPEIDLSEIPDTLTMMQWEGIRFIPDDNRDYINVSYWEDTDYPSQIAYEYGNGCVFLSGCHPELEEDSNRDNSDYFDHHSDPETDWPLVLQVSKWMVETSTWDNASINPTSTTTTTVTTNTTTGSTAVNPLPTEFFIAIGAASIVVVVLVALLVKRR